MMSTQWNTTKTDYDGDSINNNDSRNGKSSLSMPDALREEFRNLCTARTRNIKFVLKALEKKTATVTKEKKVDEVEGKKKKSIHEAATVTKRRRSSSVSGEESGEEESTSHSMSSDGEEDEESNSGLSDSGVISESHSSICDEDLPHHDEIEDHELSSSPDRSEELACQLDCFCHTLKKWLHEQGKRDRNILLEDEHYRERAQNYVVDVKTIKEAMLSAFDPIPTLSVESYRYAGDRDRLGRIHGRGSVYFPNGRKFSGIFDKGIREGPGELVDKDGGKILSGTYVNDHLDGIAEIAVCDGGVLEVNFDHGIASGPGRRFNPDGFLQWLGRYRSGVPEGTCWRTNDNEGWYVGETSKQCRMSGDSIIYLYPDLHTALVGKWDNDSMKRAKLTKVVGLTQKDGYPYPVLAEPLDNDCVTYCNDLSGITEISSSPLLCDPYETMHVQCLVSTLNGGGEGLFAARDLAPGTVVSFYNGVRFHDCHAFNDWDHNSYKIRLNEKKKQILDIPFEYRDLKNYCASLAHKVNHSFLPNAKFSDFAHPRFGRILCVKTTKTLKKGDELFCNYGYNLDDCPEWYKELHSSTFIDKRANFHK